MSGTDTVRGAEVGTLGRVFAREIRRVRQLRGMSQTDLCRVLVERYGLRFYQATVDRVEKAIRPCRLDEAYAIADALGSTVEEMLACGPGLGAALRQLDGIERQARESELRLLHAIHTDLASVLADRERVADILARHGDPATSPAADRVQLRAWEVLALLDRISAWAGGVAASAPHIPVQTDVGTP